MITKIKNKNQVTIPADIVKKLKLKINDQLQLEVVNGRIVMTPVEVIEKDFFETELGKEIKEALEEYRVEKAKGNIKTYDTVDDMFNDIGAETNG
ncbi:MAG TPA: AbrB/MazE/SpoVT family DNA-binding domain-containing protein [Bacillota bacterium]|jgi:antitoxin MazE|nr:AbrB/MazE/SpoVT family DNA-binding domain-containing protein [Bacillota bacterium]HQE65842.1 AbrB/MazE/SpoVT family DNA-binding domain-containing protein [Bacillota bacterium]HQJ36578.1 AbrB/MazE/SpoVT family DNA-binding domain-containing protein [Bacillota bacterium]HQL37039.1 AbrB/MazE/SpoVT family DNA-binding domain-containing protein [Bacillota bacterium]HRS20869.1 AbrB/MazE/SpoVT family DNA-binding domain-containing protein [Clostridia bacterium]